jgi:hypothetical protein
VGDIDASELVALAQYFGEAGRDVERKVYPVVKEHAEQLRDDWKKNARQTAGRHGRHYPNAITTEQIPVAREAWWEVGPETRRKQGGMSFEHGSRNQPPHLDGANAAIGIEPKFIKAMDELVRTLLP